MPDKPNPLEALVMEFADHYVSMVETAAAAISPNRPWWTTVLKPDEEVFRWMQIREPIVTWLADISPYMNWPSLEVATSTASLRELFTGPLLDAVVPGPLRVDERADGLKEMVQSAGPWETARHIARVEAMVRRRQSAAAATAPPDEPEAPDLRLPG
jgi:hypothetical protein